MTIHPDQRVRHPSQKGVPSGGRDGRPNEDDATQEATDRAANAAMRRSGFEFASGKLIHTLTPPGERGRK